MHSSWSNSLALLGLLLGLVPKATATAAEPQFDNAMENGYNYPITVPAYPGVTSCIENDGQNHGNVTWTSENTLQEQVIILPALDSDSHRKLVTHVGVTIHAVCGNTTASNFTVNSYLTTGLNDTLLSDLSYTFWYDNEVANCAYSANDAISHTMTELTTPFWTNEHQVKITIIPNALPNEGDTCYYRGFLAYEYVQVATLPLTMYDVSVDPTPLECFPDNMMDGNITESGYWAYTDIDANTPLGPIDLINFTIPEKQRVHIGEMVLVIDVYCNNSVNVDALSEKVYFNFNKDTFELTESWNVFDYNTTGHACRYTQVDSTDGPITRQAVSFELGGSDSFHFGVNYNSPVVSGGEYCRVGAQVQLYQTNMPIPRNLTELDLSIEPVTLPSCSEYHWDSPNTAHVNFTYTNNYGLVNLVHAGPYPFVSKSLGVVVSQHGENCQGAFDVLFKGALSNISAEDVALSEDGRCMYTTVDGVHASMLNFTDEISSTAMIIDLIHATAVANATECRYQVTLMMDRLHLYHYAPQTHVEFELYEGSASDMHLEAFPESEGTVYHNAIYAHVDSSSPQTAAIKMLDYHPGNLQSQKPVITGLSYTIDQYELNDTFVGCTTGFRTLAMVNGSRISQWSLNYSSDVGRQMYSGDGSFPNVPYDPEDLFSGINLKYDHFELFVVPVEETVCDVFMAVSYTFLPSFVHGPLTVMVDSADQVVINCSTTIDDFNTYTATYDNTIAVPGTQEDENKNIVMVNITESPNGYRIAGISYAIQAVHRLNYRQRCYVSYNVSVTYGGANVTTLSKFVDQNMLECPMGCVDSLGAWVSFSSPMDVKNGSLVVTLEPGNDSTNDDDCLYIGQFNFDLVEPYTTVVVTDPYVETADELLTCDQVFDGINDYSTTTPGLIKLAGTGGDPLHIFTLAKTAVYQSVKIYELSYAVTSRGRDDCPGFIVEVFYGTISISSYSSPGSDVCQRADFLGDFSTPMWTAQGEIDVVITPNGNDTGCSYYAQYAFTTVGPNVTLSEGQTGDNTEDSTDYLATVTATASEEPSPTNPSGVGSSGAGIVQAVTGVNVAFIVGLFGLLTVLLA